MPLAGKTILVTRAAHQAVGMVREIERRGGTAIVFPTIEIAPPQSWEACDRAIAGLYMYDGVIFTSANGVEFFFQRLHDRGVNVGEMQSKKIFVVGGTTKQAIEHRGVSVTAMPERFTAADLALVIDQEDLHDRTFLFPRGNLGDDQLAGSLKLLGARVDSVIVYRTRPPKPENVASVRTMLLEGAIDVITFTSPSTAQNFFASFPNDAPTIVSKSRIAVIGPVTAEAIKKLGHEVDIVARASTMESLLESIAERLAP